jgi:ABC-type Mn2+/Zn2+ transport system permease subunit
MIDMLGLPFVQMALLASLPAGQLATYLGVHIVLKRIVFVGIALAQVATLGVAFGQFFGLHSTACALVFSLIGAAFFTSPLFRQSLPRESLIGVAYAAASAFAILLVAKNPLGEMDVLALIFGNLLGVTATQVLVLALVAAAVLALHGFFYKEFLFVAFDPEMAEATGYGVWRWELLFSLLLGVTFAVSVSVAGVLVVFAYLVIPATTALLLNLRLPATLFVAMALSALGSFMGVYFSYVWDLPTGPSIVATLTCGLLAIEIIKRFVFWKDSFNG